MADRIKGLKIVLGADTSELVSAIYNVNSAISKTQANLRDINKALKLDPGDVNLLKDKQSELSSAIEQTKQKIEEEEKALQALSDKGVDETSEQFRNLKTQIDIDNASLKDLQSQMKDFGSVGKQVLQDVGSKMQEVGKKIQSVGDSISSVGSSLTTKLTVPIVAAGTTAVAKFAEVDKTMNLVAQTMGIDEEQANSLNTAMENAAKNSTFGMNDAATAMLNFARAGLNAEEAAAAIAPAMNLAAGAGGELEVVSAGLTATINGFGDSFQQTEYYANVFANACNNSALDVNTLSEAMSVAAPIFAASGKTVEDAALYMGIMGNAGIEASVAANSLKTGFARLADGSGEVGKELEALNVEIFNSDGTMRDLVTVQQELHDAFAGLSEEEQLAASSTIFGKNQMASWLALINTAPADVSALSDAINVTSNTTQEMADAMMGGFGGSIESLKSSIDVLMTSLGRLAAEYLTPVIEKIQGVVDKFMALDDETKNHIIQIAGIVAAVGPVLLIVGKVITGIGAVISAVGTITTAIGAVIPIVTGIGSAIGAALPVIAGVAAPVLGIAAAIGVVIAAIVQIIKHWDEIKEATLNAVTSMSTAWENFKNLVSQKWTEIKTNVVNAVNNIFTSVVNKFEQMKTNAVNKITNLKTNAVNTFNNMRASISSVISNIYTTIVNGFQNAVSYITSLPSRAIGWGRDIINGIVNGIYNAFGNLVSAVSDIANTIASYIHFSEPDVGPLADFHSYMPDMMQQLAQGIQNGIPKLENAMSSMAQSMVPSFGNVNGVAGSAGANSTMTNSVSINVYGAQGQDVSELADLIEQKIADNVIRRGVAFG